MSKQDINLTANTEETDPWADFQHIDLEGDIFKQIFKYSIIPTIVHDLSMNIIDVNDSALEEFGYSYEEFLHKSVFDLHIKEELEHSAEVLEKLKHEKRLSVETSFKRKDGSVFFAEVTPCKYILGDKPLIHVFIQNITERKLAEKKLQIFNASLKVEMNKVATQAGQIKQKNKELEEFAFVAAHDLKAPMTNITTLTHLIDVESIVDEQDKDLFERLKSNINQLDKTVFTLNEVINFKTRLKDEKERLSFKKIFDEIKESIAEQLQSSEALIEEDFSECPEIDYPPLHLKSIMQNLLTNAVKYKNPEKKLRIMVKTTKLKGRDCFTITDNGLGFDSVKKREKLFGLFKRLHTHVEGKGIGMYIVKSIVDTHRGEIEVISKPNQGAMFRVYLNKEKND